MIALSLAEFAAITGGELRVFGTDTPETLVDGVVDTDSRTMEPGSIFVAKPGAETDGHRFVGAAVQAGAVLAIVEHPVDDPITQIVVADVVSALADLAREVVARVRAIGHLRIVGITGSNGKTTTKNFLARILEAEGETVSPIKSYNNEVGAPVTMLRVTEQHPVPRLRVRRGRARQHRAPRRSRRTGRRGRADGRHGARRRIRRHRGDGESQVGARDGRTHRRDRGAQHGRLASRRDARTRRRSRECASSASVRAPRRTSARMTSRSPHPAPRCTIEVDGDRLPLHLQVLGAHHVGNALAAIAASAVLGVPASDAVARLETVEIAERWRMQPLGNDRVRIINDAYNASPDSMAAALRTLAQITGPEERTVAVLGAMTELGESAGEEHDRIGLLAVRLNIQRIVVVGPEARRLYLSAVGEGSWNSEAVHLPDQDAAFEYLRTELRDGDRVLVKSSNSVGLRHLGDRLGELFS